MQTNDQKFYEGTNGSAVILIHGITSGAAQMIPMAKFLNDYGYSVWSVNLAGHGTYPEDLLHTTCDDIIRKAENDYQYLKSIMIRFLSADFRQAAAFNFILPQSTRKLPELFSYHHRSYIVKEHL